MNDVVVAETMLARLIGVAGDGSEPAALVAPQGQLAFAAGGVLGWHRRRVAENRSSAGQGLERIRPRPAVLGPRAERRYMIAPSLPQANVRRAQFARSGPAAFPHCELAALWTSHAQIAWSP